MKKPDWRIWIENKRECKLWLNNYIKKKVLIKREDESNFYLRKTEHNLKFANRVYEKHDNEILQTFGKETFYDWVINIYYYAIYHSALALVSKRRFSSKSHYATLCFLIYNYYHYAKFIEKTDIALVANLLDKEDIETIGFSKDLRERASYDVHESFEKRLIEDTRIKTVNFINKVKTILTGD